MGTIEIRTLWGWRHGTDFPELMVAWDEFSVDENHDGFVKACEQAKREWGSDLREHRLIEIRVPEAAIVEAFRPPKVEGTI
jgi:hypothetical protein